jgi:hypothetical protein
MLYPKFCGLEERERFGVSMFKFPLRDSPMTLISRKWYSGEKKNFAH